MRFITTTDGQEVDLTDSKNLRKGMVFRSADGERVTLLEPDSLDGLWFVLEWPLPGDSMDPAGEAWTEFLGCDPALASPEDVKRYGSASQ